MARIPVTHHVPSITNLQVLEVIRDAEGCRVLLGYTTDTWSDGSVAFDVLPLCKTEVTAEQFEEYSDALAEGRKLKATFEVVADNPPLAPVS